ncbi:hypothetical protein LSH36_156g09044 [Paralvinella palmiformis]|uniref:Uncharacterized protein n=1 Tax=Paralvinella palmiformis TaxID=53620 RepID=A0AAD9JUC1_9ANNE|nr:hypothetical protein LSH36_156g09044 [Paralvinella palmiformis]
MTGNKLNETLKLMNDYPIYISDYDIPFPFVGASGNQVTDDVMRRFVACRLPKSPMSRPSSTESAIIRRRTTLVAV